MKDLIFSIIVMTIIISFFCCAFYFGIVRESLARNRVQKIIDKEVINGNKAALLIRRSRFISVFDYPKNEFLIKEALKGNEDALKALEPCGLKEYLDERKK